MPMQRDEKIMRHGRGEGFGEQQHIFLFSAVALRLEGHVLGYGFISPRHF